jgi:hypothetical protein
MSASQAWRELVFAGIRSRFGFASLAAMVALTVRKFTQGSAAAVCNACLAIIAITYLRVPWAVALAIAARRHRQL